MDRSEQETNSRPFRSGYVAIIGEPNVGKSTLMNSFLGQKISIVTNKPQTTRHKIVGILTKEAYQVVFLDTPGLLEPKYVLHESMMNFARSAIHDADLVLFMIDGTHYRDDADGGAAFRLLRGENKPVYLLVNKIDLVDKRDLLSLIAVQSQRYSFNEIFPISALIRTAIQELLEFIVAALPEHAPFYPADAVSEHSERFFVAEIIREKIFEMFREEIPYSATVD